MKKVRMVNMMPLAFLDEGKPGVIKKIGGKTQTRQFLETLGFVPGSAITVVSRINGNIIVSIKESRVAISREMATQIMI